jgi:ABC-type polysaccharide/polyol phosphate export permease
MKVAMWLVALLRGEQDGLKWEDDVNGVFWMVLVTFVLLVVAVALVLAVLGSVFAAVSFVFAMVISAIALFTSSPPQKEK